MREWNVLLEVEEEENRMKNGLGGDKHLSDFLTTPAPPIFMAKVILPSMLHKSNRRKYLKRPFSLESFVAIWRNLLDILKIIAKYFNHSTHCCFEFWKYLTSIFSLKNVAL